MASSIFMLGAASERLIYLAAEHIDRLLADPSESARMSGLTKVRLLKEWIVAQLPELKKKYSNHREAFVDVEDKFDSLYNTYRYLRNDVGHPKNSVPIVDVNQVKALLFSFGLYAKAVNDIVSIP
jgi:hypothetical protein